MSVILDALRKSEHERQRGAVPGLAQVPTVTHRATLPRWALAVMALLGAAVLVLAGAWLQSLQRPAQESARAADAVPAPFVPAAEPQAPLPSALAPSVPPMSAEPILPPAPPAPARAPVGSQSLADAVTPAARPPPLPSDRTVGAPAAPQAAPTATEPTLPSVAALLAQGIALPPLKLELHAYTPEASARFVFINGRKYAEGQRLAEGPEVVAIAPNGAVLSYLGQRFLLGPE
jgi:general secretion pathway protein B